MEGYDEGQVTLNDPALGRRRVSWMEFDNAFTGITLTFAKTDRFAPNAAVPKAW